MCSARPRILASTTIQQAARADARRYTHASHRLSRWPMLPRRRSTRHARTLKREITTVRWTDKNGSITPAINEASNPRSYIVRVTKKIGHPGIAL